MIDERHIVWHTEEKVPFMMNEFEALPNYGYSDLHMLPGDIVRHFKRETVIFPKIDPSYLYIYRGCVRRIALGDIFVLYTAMYNKKDGDVMIGKNYIRPYDMFISDVDTKKYPKICQIRRFELANESEKKMVKAIMKEKCII